MTNKILKKSLIVVLIAVFIVCIIQMPSLAASFELKAGKTTMTVGETTTLTATATGCGGKFTISSSDTSIVSISGETSDWIEDESKTLTISANKAGTATLTMTAVDVADSSTADDITGSKTVKITVNDKAQVSDNSDATLKSITVAGKTYNSPSTDFTITVSADVETVDVSAVVATSGATVSGTGTKDIATGTNTVTLTVKGPNGGQKTYAIRIRKLAETNSNPNVPDTEPQATPEENLEEEPQLLRLAYLVIDDVELTPEFDPEIFEYTVFITNLDSLDVVATANYDDAEIEITGDKDLVDGDNEIIIKLTRNAGEDEVTEEVSYRILANKSTIVINEPEESKEDGGGFFSTTGGKIAMAVAAGGIIIILIVYGIIKSKSDRSQAKRAAKRYSSYDDFDD